MSKLPGHDSRVRSLLRRAMPWVALLAAVLQALRFVAPGFRAPAAGLTLIALFYYLPKAIRWTWRKLLWRVRRRLAITYLFVGVAPVALLVLLVGVAAWGITAEATARGVAAVMASLESQLGTSAQTLAARFSNFEGRHDQAASQKWLDLQATSLATSLPTPVLLLWRDPAAPPLISPTLDASVPSTLLNRIAAPAPAWLASAESWRGMTVLPPSDPEERLGQGALAASARIVDAGDTAKAAILLVMLPLDRQVVEHLRLATGIHLHPFLATGDGNAVNAGSGGMQISVGRRRVKGGDVAMVDGEATERVKDQFGEFIPEVPYVVVTDATDWRNGETDSLVSFMFDWSPASAAARTLKGSPLAGGWQVALAALGVFFLLVEGAALVLAILITREVTGTVHELDHGTAVILGGDFSHRIRPRSRDQLGQLADHFNEMSSRIEGMLEERVVHERLEQELRIAAQVQSQLFPRKAPSLARTQIAGECRAARGVAGDYYDYIELAPGQIAIALGDVSGKGISASLVMSNLQASLRMQTTFMMESGVPQGEAGALTLLTGRINRQLCGSIQPNRFATMFLGLYDDATGELRYINAGHNAPILVHADGSIERLAEGGMVVGIVEGAQYKEGGATLSPGSALVVFSDGISDAEDPADAEYGEERLTRFVTPQRTLDAKPLLGSIFEEIDRWMAGRDRGDDQTIVVLKLPLA